MIDPTSNTKLKLRKVMYIPEFSKKIISAGALINDDTTMTIEKDRCKLMNTRNNAEINFLKQSDSNMYYIIPTINNSEEETVNINIKEQKPKLRVGGWACKSGTIIRPKKGST